MRRSRLIKSLGTSAPNFLDLHPRAHPASAAAAAPPPRAKLSVFVQLAGERFALCCDPGTPVSWLLSEALRRFTAAKGDHPEVERIFCTRTGQDVNLGEDVGSELANGDCLEAVLVEEENSDYDDDDSGSSGQGAVGCNDGDEEEAEPETITYLRGRGTTAVGAPLLLHMLCWDDDVEGLTAATAHFRKHSEGFPHPHPVLDRCDTRGNTPLQLALQLRRGHAALVLVRAGADVIRKDSGGWTVIQSAAKLRDRELLAEMVEAGYRQTWQGWQRRLTWLEPLLANIPDFDLTLLLEVKCVVPLVSRVLPSDRLRIRKAGARLRVDSTLASLNGKRGSFSTLVLLDAGGQAYFIDHTARTIGRLEKRLMEPTSQQIEDAVKRLSVLSISQAALLTRGCSISPVHKWGKTKQPAVEKVGDFASCVYKVNGGALCIKTRAPVEENGRDSKPASHSVVRSMAEASRRRGSIVVESTVPSLPGGSAQPRRARMMSAWSSAYDGGGGSAGFDDYFGSASPRSASPTSPGFSGPRPEHAVVTLPPERTKTELKAFDGIKLHMAQGFPLSKQMMVSILDVMALTSQRFDNVRTFLVSSLPPGFPVAFRIPVAPSLSGAISFPRCSLSTAEPSIFAVPASYAMDALAFPFDK